jgi:hypothetical protein
MELGGELWNVGHGTTLWCFFDHAEILDLTGMDWTWNQE